MAARATITFKALGPEGIEPATRVVVLDEKNSCVFIGRSSKSPIKGLRAAGDNAWFDSPVMSRNHAKILLDLESKEVKLQDIGSMHGTHVDGITLRENMSVVLKPECEVVFGAIVKRGSEVFAACIFQLISVISTDNAPTIYDLTTDDIDSSNVNDMANPPTPPSQLSLPSPNLSNKNIAESGSPQGESPVTSEHCLFSEGSVVSSANVDSEISSSPSKENFKADEWRGYSYGFSIRESDSEDASYSEGSAKHSASVSEEDSSTSDQELDDACEDPERTQDESQDQPVGDQEQNTTASIEIADSMTDDSPAHSLATDEIPSSETYLDAATVIETLNSLCRKVLACDADDEKDIPKTFDLFAPVSGTSRQPSPSDAAMAKSMLVSRQIASAPWNLGSQCSSQPAISAQALGDKTGKHEFFEARELNKGICQGQSNSNEYVGQGSGADSIETSNVKFGYPTLPKAPMLSSAANPPRGSYHSTLGPARRLGINDLIDNPVLNSSGQKSLKRKNDQISGTTLEDLVDRAISAGELPEVDTQSIQSAIERPKYSAVDHLNDKVMVDEKVLMESPRPTKKLKTFMSSAIKVTAGIAVGGVSVFGLLAATAPSLV